MFCCEFVEKSVVQSWKCTFQEKNLHANEVFHFFSQSFGKRQLSGASR